MALRVGRFTAESTVNLLLLHHRKKKRKSVRKSPLDGVRLAFSHSVCVKPREERRSSDFGGAGIETERLVVGAGHTVLATWTVESHAGRSRSFVRS